MKELIKNLFQTSNERIKNPFIGSFIFSWIAFNWKSILTIIFSKTTIEERISYVSNCFSEIEFTLFYPLIFSAFYVLGLPYLMWLIEYLSKYAKIGRKKNLVDEKIDDLIDKQKIAKEERKYEEERAGNLEISLLNTKIAELTTDNEEKQKSLNSLKIDLTEIKKEKNRLEQYINLENPDNVEYSESEKKKLDEEYNEFLKTEVSTYFEKIGTEISQFKSIPKDTDSIIIEKLVYSGLVKRIDDEENQRKYYLLTKRGKYFWKNYVLSKKIMTQEEMNKLMNDDLPF